MVKLKNVICIFGTMKCGKTTTCLTECYKIVNTEAKNVLMARYTRTEKYIGNFITYKKSGMFDMLFINTLEDLLNVILEREDEGIVYDHVYVDEIQLFNNTEDALHRLIKQCNRIVFVGISEDYQKIPYKNYIYLKNIGKQVVLETICCNSNCTRMAKHNKRVSMGELEKHAYEPVCEVCYDESIVAQRMYTAVDIDGMLNII